MSEEMRRDCAGDLECDYCGGGASSTLGGEHIWKCSEVVPNNEIEELVQKWRTHPDYVGSQFRVAAHEIEELINDD